MRTILFLVLATAVSADCRFRRKVPRLESEGPKPEVMTVAGGSLAGRAALNGRIP